MNYIELQCTSHFSFLRGASSCEALFAQAALYGMEALAITDRNTLAGTVRAHEAAKQAGVRSIVGCRLDLIDDSSVLVYPMNKAGYGNLCRLLTVGKRRAGKGKCELGWEDIPEYSKGLLAILVPDEADSICARQLRLLKDCFGSESYIALTIRRRPGDAMRLYQLSSLAAQFKVRTVATNDVLYHMPSQRIMQDVVTCIRLKCTIDSLGFRRERTMDRYLKQAEDMAHLFRDYPDALARTKSIADKCRFSLDELHYQYPAEIIETGKTAQESLEEATWEGAKHRYPEGIPNTVLRQLVKELRLIAQMKYAPYFLTVNSIVQYARSEGILCQGRGSAANSAVCFVLGITSIDPGRHNLLFERFISADRNEPPDIDVDFEHERREMVIRWIYDTYGRDRAALCATISRYRAKGAIRDVGKVMGLTEDIITGLSQQVWAWSNEGIEAKHAEALNLNMNDRRLRLAVTLAKALIGVPRQSSQHPGGFVLTFGRLDELVPIEPAAMDGRQVIEWDKDDIDALKFMKVDVLGLGMMTALKRSFTLLEEAKGIRMELATIPPDDVATFDMICQADTIGTFQIESRAQMNMLPKTLPRTYYDLVIQVAVVRPGPIQGDMVHPYLRRRHGLEKVTFPNKQLEEILGRTLGIPLFQEQAMQVAIECAGFTPGEADEFRRSMAKFKFTGGVVDFKDKLIKGMVQRGYTPVFAKQIFEQLKGFGSYGFPESHSASFAILAYVSSWLKCHHPDVFCAAILNSQPMGFYAPAQIVQDAQKHGVEVLPICVNASRWDCTLEETRGRYKAVRLGMRFVKGLSDEAAAKLVAARAETPFSDIADIGNRAPVEISALKQLANADAFKPSLQLERREALWAIKALRRQALPLFAAIEPNAARPFHEIQEEPIIIKPMTAGREVVSDYQQTGLSLKSHPVTFLRQSLKDRRIVTCAETNSKCNGYVLRTSGLVLVRQKPGSAKGVMFISIEDETGMCNVVVWPTLYEMQRRIILTAGMIAVHGKVQREGQVVHLIAHRLFDLSGDLAAVGERDVAFPLPHGRGDEFKHGGSPDSRHLPRPVVKPRDIYIPDLHLDTIKVKTRDFR